MPYTYDVPFDVAHRKVNDWGYNNGYPSGWPTYEQRTNVSAREYNVALIKPNTNAVSWRDVPASDMGNPNPTDFRVRMTKAQDYARTHTDSQGRLYAFGYPNFHQADYGKGVVYGTFLVNPGVYADYYEPTSSELGLGSDPRPQPLDAWFRGVHQWAVRINDPTGSRYATGRPNGHWNYYNGAWHLGVHCFRSNYATTTWQTRSSLGYPITPTSGWAVISPFRTIPSDLFYYWYKGLPVGVPTPSPFHLTQITNNTQDVNGRRTIPLRIWYFPNGSSSETPFDLRPDETRSFNRVPTENDTWEVRPINVSAAFLQNSVSLQFTWDSP